MLGVLDPGSGMDFFRIPDLNLSPKPVFESLVTICWVKSSLPKFFSSAFQKINKFVCEICGYRKRFAKFFLPLLRFLDPGWVKIGIRDEHPGSATLHSNETHYLIVSFLLQ